MKNNRYIIPVLLALVILGVCIYFVSMKGSNKGTDTMGKTTEKTQGVTQTWDAPTKGWASSSSGNTAVSGPEGFQP